MFCCHPWVLYSHLHFDGLVQERRNSSALAVELVFLALTIKYIYTDDWYWERRNMESNIKHIANI